MTPTRLKNPPHCPSGYVLHAYCDHENSSHDYNEFPHQPERVETFGQAKACLKRRGWIFHDDHTATCPKCVKALGLKRKG